MADLTAHSILRELSHLHSDIRALQHNTTQHLRFRQTLKPDAPGGEPLNWLGIVHDFERNRQEFESKALSLSNSVSQGASRGYRSQIQGLTRAICRDLDSFGNTLRQHGSEINNQINDPSRRGSAQLGDPSAFLELAHLFATLLLKYNEKTK